MSSPAELQQISVDTTVLALAQRVVPPTAMYGGSGLAIFAGLTANEFVAIVGAIIAVLGFFVNWYYKHRQWKLYEKHINSSRRTGDSESPTADFLGK